MNSYNGCLKVFQNIDSPLGHILGVVSHLVLRWPGLEVVGLVQQTYRLHEFEGIRHVVNLIVPEHHQQRVTDVLDVLVHHIQIHANQMTLDGILIKQFANLNSLPNYVVGSDPVQLVDDE